jgi:hypothetical protein
MSFSTFFVCMLRQSPVADYRPLAFLDAAPEILLPASFRPRVNPAFREIVRLVG